MRVISLVAENIKRLKAIEIRPDPKDALVPITGANGEGKSSTLDALWWAITGKKNIEEEPIRTGATSARILLDIGELVITRTFRKNAENKTVSELTCETDKGARVSSPQAAIDALIGSIALDPLEFERADDKKQFDILKRFVPDFDFEMEEIRRKQVFDDRTTINRRLKEAHAIASRFVINPEDAIVRVDEDAILDKLKTLAEQNDETRQRAANRQKMRDTIAANKENIELNAQKIAEARARIVALEGESAGLLVWNNEKSAKLASAPELPEILSTDTVMDELAAAKKANAQVANREERASAIDSVAHLQTEADAFDTALITFDQNKAAAIAKAQLPVTGLGIGEGIVLFNGTPFRQASDAERLRVSIAIAMYSNPKLRVIRVRDGSLLDSKSMRLLEEMARERDYQVWIERVDESGKIGFVIEDGMLVGQSLAAAPIPPLPPKLVTAPKPQPKPVAEVKPSTPATRSFKDDAI